MGDELAKVSEEVAEVAERVVDPAASWHWKAGDSARVAIAGFTVVIGGVVASRGVPSWENATFLKINGLPDSLYPVVWPVMQLGNVWVGSAVAVGAAVFVPRWRSRAVLVATPALAWVGAKVIKNLVDRGRPAAEGLEVLQRGAPEDGLGYISGHTAVTFALAAAVGAHLRGRWALVPLGAAVLVGLARIYVGVHLPLDVVGGAAAGVLVGEAARLVELMHTRRAARPVATEDR